MHARTGSFRLLLFKEQPFLTPLVIAIGIHLCKTIKMAWHSNKNGLKLLIWWNLTTMVLCFLFLSPTETAADFEITLQITWRLLKNLLCFRLRYNISILWSCRINSIMWGCVSADCNSKMNECCFLLQLLFSYYFLFSPNLYYSFIFVLFFVTSSLELFTNGERGDHVVLTLSIFNGFLW